MLTNPNTPTIAMCRKGSKFAERKISKALRNDYEQYLMGQTKIAYVAKLRGKTKYEIHRIFNILYNEKLTAYKKISQ